MKVVANDQVSLRGDQQDVCWRPVILQARYTSGQDQLIQERVQGDEGIGPANCHQVYVFGYEKLANSRSFPSAHENRCVNVAIHELCGRFLRREGKQYRGFLLERANACEELES